MSSISLIQTVFVLAVLCFLYCKITSVVISLIFSYSTSIMFYVFCIFHLTMCCNYIIFLKIVINAKFTLLEYCPYFGSPLSAPGRRKDAMSVVLWKNEFAITLYELYEQRLDLSDSLKRRNKSSMQIIWIFQQPKIM